ncbi:MAG: hypothetical protein AAFO07_24270 [Bacteroidota bacterium]
MKLKLFIVILISSLLFSCQNENKLNGNYSICIDGQYAEVYFKRDSMRMASESEWVRLSKWRKIEILNDTLFFETFGEWRDNAKAKIKYNGLNNIELKFPKDIEDKKFGMTQSLERIKGDFDIEESEEFWTAFKTRKSLTECKSEK